MTLFGLQHFTLPGNVNLTTNVVDLVKDPSSVGSLTRPTTRFVPRRSEIPKIVPVPSIFGHGIDSKGTDLFDAPVIGHTGATEHF